ncbi:ribonuclease HI [Feifania hominis]|uniref:Ribonuclease H n=1 Tax=Feifania hominis TaxID=2763660 RepID=A0A926DGF8_9FIRM|nr:ribonuclease HI [Feifania hominis]MBC8536595.1 ribonuclease HI [Feifania hominis]
MKEVTIYTDGACSGNPGPGGYGAILQYGPHRRELSEGYRRTTNNRMELLGAIRALELLQEPCAVTLYSDSKYLVDAIEKGWVDSWQRRGWRKADNKPALNRDLWQRLLALLERHKVRFVWVKGHESNAGNNRCDELAVAASRAPTAVDEAFEQENSLPQ